MNILLSTSNKLQITSTITFVLFIFSIGFVSLVYAQHQQEESQSSSIIEIHVPEDPMKIKLVPNEKLYVTSFTGSSITVIDTKENQISQQIQLENNEQAMDVLPIPERDKVYVPIFGAGKINVYSLENGSLEDVIFLPESTIEQETLPSDEIQEDITFQTSVWSRLQSK